MMSEDNSKAYELLGEVAKLLRKYGKETFLDLATMLRDSYFTERLVEVLENTTKLSVPRKRTKTRLSLKEEEERFRQSVVILGEKEPEKASIIISLLNSLKTKTTLSSLRALTDFISDQGLSIPKAKLRDKVVLSFLRQCIGMSLIDLRALAGRVPPDPSSKDGDRSLAGWGRVILDRKTEKN